MGGSIRLSKKHGLAPALTFCNICGEETNEIALLGEKADSVMKELYANTDGKYGDKDGYQDCGLQKIPSRELCGKCMNYLNSGGMILIAKDRGEYLRLDKEQTDSLVMKIADAKGRIMDIEKMRGKITRLNKAFWFQDGENIRLRDPVEWSD